MHKEHSLKLMAASLFIKRENPMVRSLRLIYLDEKPRSGGSFGEKPWKLGDF